MKLLKLITLTILLSFVTSWFATLTILASFCDEYYTEWLCSGHGGNWLTILIISIIITTPIYAFILKKKMYKNESNKNT